jgi:mitogen-activated protein kinase organizer 1
MFCQADPITSLTTTKSSESLLISTLTSTLTLLDKANGKLLQSYKAPNYTNTTYRIRSALGMNDSVALSGSEDGHIYVWDVVSGKVLYELRHADGSTGLAKKDVVSAVAWCSSGRLEWCSAGGDGQVVVWGMEGG